MLRAVVFVWVLMEGVSFWGRWGRGGVEVEVGVVIYIGGGGGSCAGSKGSGGGNRTTMVEAWAAYEGRRVSME